MKAIANEIFGVFEKHKKGECTYDRALEDVSNIIEKHANSKLNYNKDTHILVPIQGIKNRMEHIKKCVEILSNDDPKSYALSQQYLLLDEFLSNIE